MTETTTTYTLNVQILDSDGETVTTMKFENPRSNVTSNTVVAAVSNLLPSSSDTTAAVATGRKLFTGTNGKFYDSVGKVEYVETVTTKTILKEKT